MDIMDIFNSDPWNRVDMVEAINVAPGVPTRIGQMGLFNGGRGTTTPDIGIQVNQKGHLLIQTAARGSDPEYNHSDPKELRLIRAPHLPQKDAVMADELIAAYNSGSMDQTVNDKLEDMRVNHDLTHEWHMLNALRGKVLDADGTSTVYDWYDFFGLTRRSINLGAVGGVYQMCEELKRQVTKSLGFQVFGGITVLVEETGFRNIIRDAQVLQDYNRLDMSAHARTNHAFNSVTLYGVTFEEYSGYFNDTTPFVEANRGYAFPTSSMFYKRYNAPAPQTSSVGTRGVPFYMTKKLLDHEAGIEIKTNTNPLFVCERPESLVELVLG